MVEQATANGSLAREKRWASSRRAALRYPSDYKQLEWWDVREGRLPNPDVQYPELKQAAAFICTSHTCSPPIFDPNKLPSRVDKLLSIR